MPIVGRIGGGGGSAIPCVKIGSLDAETLTLDASYARSWINVTRPGEVTVTVNWNIFSAGDRVAFKKEGFGELKFDNLDKVRFHQPPQLTTRPTVEGTTQPQGPGKGHIMSSLLLVPFHHGVVTSRSSGVHRHPRRVWVHPE